MERIISLTVQPVARSHSDHERHVQVENGEIRVEGSNHFARCHHPRPGRGRASRGKFRGLQSLPLHWHGHPPAPVVPVLVRLAGPTPAGSPRRGKTSTMTELPLPLGPPPLSGPSFSASVSRSISPTTCSCNWSRQHSGTAAGKPARLQSYPSAPEGASCFGCRRPAQYLRIRPETSWRSEEFMDLRPRRLAGLGNTGAEPAVRCSSSYEAITRSSFPFSACKS